MSLSPTQRTLAALRDRGCMAAIVEKWNQFAGPHGIRQDLFGFIDVLCIEPGEKGCLGVQACGSSFSEHLTKITETRAEECLKWLAAGNRVELWGWRKVKVKRGGKAMVWKPRVRFITEGDCR